MSDYRGLIEEMEKDRAKKRDGDEFVEELGCSLNVMDTMLKQGTQAHERLVCFMYLLMRDELPTGTVCKIVTDIDEAGEEFQFTNPHLEALARDYANRIREG